MSLLSRWLFVLFAVLYLLWLATRKSNTHGPSAQAPFVDDHAMTVVLPIVQSTLDSLDSLLAPFLVPTAVLYEVAIVCPQSLVSDVHRSLRIVLSNAAHDHPKVSLYPWSGLMHHRQASLQVTARVKTQWVLILDEHGLERVAECDRAYLVHPRVIHLPVGPRGYTGSSLNWSQITPSDRIQPAAFLVPPFVAPSSLLAGAPMSSRSLVWPDLGNYVAKSTLGLFGGIVIGTDILDVVGCNTRATLPDEEADDDLRSRTLSPKGCFVLAFPHKEDLIKFLPATCKLIHQGYFVSAYLYDAFDELESGTVSARNCTVSYFHRSKVTPSLLDWLHSLESVPEIVIGLDHQDFVSSTFSLILEQPPFLNTTLMRLPRRELPYTEWIGTLTLHELRHWNVPEITLSIITNNRSHSLQRLLESIQRTLFYGDKVNIRINIDQTSDLQTMQIAHDFEWSHGDVFIHHRVIHGGLLPAVVESWYPHCDDSYGLLLEDDIELSPLSYAWVKMTLLRYKHGSSSSPSQLFGISLYQQKIIELRPTGRQPFNARTLFRSASLADPTTPYLSQTPCSWGALYFPDAWRTFHAYLALRLSQSTLPLDHPIVPGVRSNRWTRSWKKYFIELVYLRGYVMLYPNYGGFVSLSTNHLEVGSHVKDDPSEVYASKKPWFELPLMRLEGALAGPHAAPMQRLLDLPGGALPAWDRLPVLDLLGEMSSIEALQTRGEQRKRELDVCGDVELFPPSVRDLFCHVPL